MAKYGTKGWIKLWRKEMQSPLYSEEPFDKWHAWIDLCMLADDQGAVRTSHEALKNRWLWGSTHKVRAFLDSVQGAGMGAVISTPRKGTLIRINTDFLKDGKATKKTGQGAVKGADSGTEEVTSYKEVGGASLAISTPNNHTKNICALEDELGDEYE